MKIYELLESENTDMLYDRWSDYRKELTEYIIEKFAKDSAPEKPTLAIWGAGRSNDINLEELSRYFKLVLIDCDKSKPEAAIKKYKLSDEEAVAADLFFYDISLDRYEEYEELLMTGASVAEVHEFLSELLHEAVSTDLELLPSFDYSVAIGLSSQMNARLAALLYLYKENYSKDEAEEIADHIRIMDKEAVRRLYKIVTVTTAKHIMWGYETIILESNCNLNIEANEYLKKYILNSTGEENCSTTFIWPFMDDKSYRMELKIV